MRALLPLCICMAAGLLFLAGCARKPMVEDSMPMSDSMMEKTSFTVHIEDVSTPNTLQTSEGGKPVPLSPGAYAVYQGASPVFSMGEEARGNGLEEIAEDGMPMKMAGALKSMSDVAQSGVFNTPAGKAEPAPLMPGDAYDFTIEAAPGDRLTLVTMFVQSNDLFIAPDAQGIALFGADGQPTSGDVTTRLMIWDAGTEVNEEPGVGPNSKPKQANSNTGPTEGKPVRPISEVGDGYIYPPVERVIRVTLTPSQ